ncbi:MAG: dienelactone hydrolase family protein [Burkholderiaceae bacterium]
MALMIEIESMDGSSLPLYVAKPQGSPKGAVVVIQEIFGLNAHIRAVADGYAQEGYLAVAPAIFERAKPGVELGYTPEDIQAGFALKNQMEAMSETVLDDIQAAIDYAAEAGRVGIVGFCWGGLLSWRAACELGGLDAAVTYYGGGMTDESTREIGCPVLCHFAEEDSYIPLEAVEHFRQAQPEVEIHLYPTAHHGFNCDQRGSWNPAAAMLARERSLAFFAEHLA